MHRQFCSLSSGCKCWMRWMWYDTILLWGELSRPSCEEQSERRKFTVHCAVTYQVSVSSCCAFRLYLSFNKAVHSERGPIIAVAGEHEWTYSDRGGSSSRMPEPVFFHAVDNWTPKCIRLRDKTVFGQLCVTVCLLQDLRTAMHTVSCITGAVVINSMNTSVTALISCFKVSSRCDWYPCDYDTCDSELAVGLDRTIRP
jgi:hypothetical protein